VTLNWFKRGAPTTSDGIVKKKVAKLDALVVAYLGVFLDATEERISQPSTPPYPYGHTIAPPPPT